MGFTIYDAQSAEHGRSRRELPRVIAGAVRLLWAAGRRQLMVLVAVEALSAAGIAALVLLGQDVPSSGRCSWAASTCRSDSGRRSRSRACSSATRRS
jgi:hypothetical protein